MPPTSLQVVLGASGGIGTQLVQALAARGDRVRAVSRSGAVPAGAPYVEGLAADLATPEGARAATAGAAVVFHAAQPPYWRWAQDFPGLTARIADGAQAAGAKLVLADNLYLYGPAEGPLRPDTPQRPVGAKGEVRARMAAELLARHEAGRLRVTLGRASDYFGPGGVRTVAGEPLFGPLVRGRTARWPGSLDQPHTLHFLPDLARGLLILADADQADGRAWHLPAAPPITARAFITLAAQAVGVRPRMGSYGRRTIRVLGLVNRTVRELAETLHQFDRPFVSDASGFTAAFGPLEVTPHAIAVARTARWFAARG